jgi:OmpA-OmpF porin, OOP family
MNILSLIQNQLSSQTIGQISNALGEGQEQTRSALSTAFPALLGSLVGKANASPSGLGEIFNSIKQGQLQGGWTDAIGQAISGEPPPIARQSLLSSILGSKLGPVADFIASRCGIRGGSATSLLGMAAPLLMGTLGKQVSSQGLGEAGLGQLLSSQIHYLKDAIPSGLANTLGIGNLLSGTQAPTASVKSAEPASRENSYREPTSREVYSEPARASGGSGILKWAWVPLLLALAG